jgi:hypothetical protein
MIKAQIRDLSEAQVCNPAVKNLTENAPLIRSVNDFHSVEKTTDDGIKLDLSLLLTLFVNDLNSVF